MQQYSYPLSDAGRFPWLSHCPYRHRLRIAPILPRRAVGHDFSWGRKREGWKFEVVRVIFGTEAALHTIQLDVLRHSDIGGDSGRG
jgi:hypothetical protein